MQKVQVQEKVLRVSMKVNNAPLTFVLIRVSQLWNLLGQIVLYLLDFFIIKLFLIISIFVLAILHKLLD